MILNEFAQTKTNNRNYKKFKDLGHNFNIGDEIIVRIKDLSNYYYKLDENKNTSKKEYSISSGYNFLFIIDKDYTELEKNIKFYDTVI